MLQQFFVLLCLLCVSRFEVDGSLSGGNKESTTREIKPQDEGRGNGTMSANHLIYREVLTLSMEHLWTQKMHIDEIKNHCDWLQRNEVELKKLPQIVFHASRFLDEEAKKLEKKISVDNLQNDERINPLRPSLIAQIKSYLHEIMKFIDQQQTLTPEEVEKMKHEVTIAGEELDRAIESIGEKVEQMEKYLKEQKSNA